MPARVHEVPFEKHIPIFGGELKRSPFEHNTEFAKGVGRQAKLLEFVHDPRFVIRRPEFSFSFSGNKAKTFETCRVAQKLFRELENVYGIPVPVQFVVARNADGEVIFYGITRKVSPVNIDEMGETEKAAAFRELRRIFDSLMTYYENKAQSREPFLIEVMDDQYVYGTIEGCPAPRWYLVDTDPVFSGSKSYMRDMLSYAEEAFEDIQTLCPTEMPDFRRRGLALRKSLRS